MSINHKIMATSLKLKKNGCFFPKCSVCKKRYKMYLGLETRYPVCNKETLSSKKDDQGKSEDGHIMNGTLKSSKDVGEALTCEDCAKYRSVKKQYHCFVCNRLFRFKAHMFHHVLRHNASKPALCGMCGVKFENSADADTHWKLHSKGLSVVTCPVCHKPFSSKYNIKRHLELYCSKLSLNCLECNKKFSKRSLAISHLTFHRNDQRFNLDNCSKAKHKGQKIDKNMTDTKIMVKAQVTEEIDKPFECVFCLRKFKLKRHLGRHLSAMHINKTPFFCKLCNNSYITREDFEMHENNFHNKLSEDREGENSFVKTEKIPEDEFESKASLELLSGNLIVEQSEDKSTLHSELDGNDGLFKKSKCTIGDNSKDCVITNNDFTAILSQGQERLRDDKPKYIDKRLSCDFCNRKFNKKWNLNSHVALTHPQKMVYSCAICKKRFYNVLMLAGHLETHTVKDGNCRGEKNELSDGTKHDITNLTELPNLEDNVQVLIQNISNHITGKRLEKDHQNHHMQELIDNGTQQYTDEQSKDLQQLAMPQAAMQDLREEPVSSLLRHALSQDFEETVNYTQRIGCKVPGRKEDSFVNRRPHESHHENLKMKVSDNLQTGKNSQMIRQGNPHESSETPLAVTIAKEIRSSSEVYEELQSRIEDGPQVREKVTKCSVCMVDTLSKNNLAEHFKVHSAQEICDAYMPMSSTYSSVNQANKRRFSFSSSANLLLQDKVIDSPMQTLSDVDNRETANIHHQEISENSKTSNPIEHQESQRTKHNTCSSQFFQKSRQKKRFVCKVCKVKFDSRIKFLMHSKLHPVWSSFTYKESIKEVILRIKKVKSRKFRSKHKISSSYKPQKIDRKYRSKTPTNLDSLLLDGIGKNSARLPQQNRISIVPPIDKCCSYYNCYSTFTKPSNEYFENDTGKKHCYWVLPKKRGSKSRNNGDKRLRKSVICKTRSMPYDELDEQDYACKNDKIYRCYRCKGKFINGVNHKKHEEKCFTCKVEDYSELVQDGSFTLSLRSDPSISSERSESEYPDASDELSDEDQEDEESTFDGETSTIPYVSDNDLSNSNLPENQCTPKIEPEEIKCEVSDQFYYLESKKEVESVHIKSGQLQFLCDAYKAICDRPFPRLQLTKDSLMVEEREVSRSLDNAPVSGVMEEAIVSWYEHHVANSWMQA